MKTEDLISQLSAQAAPVRRLSPPSRRLTRWLVVSVPVLAVMTAVFGLRPDLRDCLADWRFVLENLAALAAGIAAAWACLESTVPGTPRTRLALPALPAALWVGLIGESCWSEWLTQGPWTWDAVLHQKCLPEVIGAGLIPAIVLVVLARKGAIFTPGLTSALAALAAAALGSAALSLFHQDDSAVISLVWHAGSAAFLSGLAALFGTRLFRVPAGSDPA